MQLTESFRLRPGLRTVTDAFLRAVENHPDELALTEGGAGVALTWREYAERVAALASGPEGAGGRARRSGRAADGQPAGVQPHRFRRAVPGAIPFSIYPTSASEQIAYIAGHAEPAVYVVEPEARQRIEEAGVSGTVFYLEDDEDGRSALDQIEGYAAGPIDLHDARRADHARRPADAYLHLGDDRSAQGRRADPLGPALYDQGDLGESFRCRSAAG